MRCYYDEGYFLPLPEGHPFPMEKFPGARRLLGGSVEVLSPPVLPFAEVARAHDPAYLRAVSADTSANGAPGLSRYARNRLGLPAHPRLLERSILETSGTVAATRAALADGRAANLAGGTHHAFPDRGLGYCVLNDVAVAVEVLRAEQILPAHILIVDTDAHQGNGNHAYFAGDPAVFTYSIHVGRNYPAEKVPGDHDVPLERYVSGAAYLRALEDSLPPVFAHTEPDLVFWISGADNHTDDRFGQMALTDADMAARDRFVLSLCEAYAAPCAILYGGGYNRIPGKTAYLHAQTIRLAAGFLE
ncbi:MAG: histone deacetylase [Opitutales bacterium]|nr:histone deacetylase [Opitutales bacterium]